ncbi:hypothetical protein GHK92_05650 [Nocardioides sp. dk4132]|uniref:hypothetical protein n=1 Tax=unclassified Nocardioides TaxID=2615069 RepID=UPI00129490CC|nr:MULTISPECIES: hypothetical protein [unclassified Nocardioides]MQW75353.1 hypothetical protein [Nocardioides sp. dk4132]QGA07502.1 hypothetical protein GFH29_08955 [Nocardioides sp. dk884]
MTETGAEQPEGPAQTGVASVDEVLASVEALAGRPLEEHVAVFEHAHERLRSALDVQPPQPGAPRPGADA